MKTDENVPLMPSSIYSNKKQKSNVSDEEEESPGTSKSLHTIKTVFPRFPKNQIILHLVLTITQIAFSTVNVFGKISLDSIEPIPLVTLRCWCCVPVALFLAFFFEEDSLYGSFIDWKNTFLKVGVGIGVVYSITVSLYLYGLQFSNPINTGTLYLLTIPMTALLGMWLKYERRMILKVVGVVFSVAGALFIIEVDQFSISDKTVIGDILVIVMCVFYSCYLVFYKKLGKGMGSLTVSFWMFLFAGIISIIPIPFFIIFGVPITSVVNVSPEAWSSTFIVCFIGTTFTFLCTNWALQNTTSLVVAMYSPLELISTVIMSLILLDFELVWQQYVGIPLILMGLVLVLYAKHKEEKEHTVPIEV